MLINRLQYFLLIFLSGLGSSVIYSQTANQISSDSLLVQDYPTLTDKFWNSFDNSGEFTELYARAYLAKAKQDKDSIEIARGFEYLAQISEPLQNIAFSDSIIIYSRNSGHPNYPAVGYALKGYWNYQLGNYDEALNGYLKAYSSAKEKGNIAQQIEVNQFIGVIKSAWGDHEEALKLYKEHLSFIKEQPDYQSKYREDYLITLHNLSLAQIRDKNYAAADKTIYEAYSTINSDEDPIYKDFLFASAISLFFQGKRRAAEDSINKVIPLLEDKTDLAMANYYQGMLSDNTQKRLFFFSNVDSIYNKTNIEFPELRTVYETFVDYYRSKGQESAELSYLKKLIVVDSRLAHNREYLNSTITKKYDTPSLIAQKNKIIQKLSHNNEKNQNLIIYISLATACIIAIAFFIYYKSKRLRRRFAILQEELKKDNVPISQPPKINTIDSSSEILLEKLEKFERTGGYTSNDVTLFSLAKMLKSNQSYLSKTINDHKGKNFPNYINDLRVKYTVERLNNDRVFRNFRIKNIAEDVGFNTSESFSRAFEKVTGMKPSYYIQQLNKK